MRKRLLVGLAVAVISAHLALLAWPDLRERDVAARTTGSTQQQLRFETRSIAPPATTTTLARPAKPSAAPAAPKLPAFAKPPQAPSLHTLPDDSAPDGIAEPRTVAHQPSALDDLLAGGESAPSSMAGGGADAAVGYAATAEPTQYLAFPDETEVASLAQDAAEARPPAIGSPAYQGPLPAVRLPPSATLQFDAKGSVKGFSYAANAQLQFMHDGLRYQARQEVSAFLIGARVQSSTGRITAHGLVPERFGDKTRSERAAHLDVDKGRVTFSGNDPEQPITEGVQDRLSIFLQLASMIAAGPERYPAGSTISINVASARATDVWTFVVDGPEVLELPGGPRTAIGLTRQRKKQHDQIARLWVAPDLHYLPVRIRITQAHGDFADLQLKSATVQAEASAF